MTDNAVPASCCDRSTLQDRGLRSCVLSVPFGEAAKLTVFTVGCVQPVVNFFGWTLITRDLLVLACGFLQVGLTGLVLYEMRTMKVVPKTPDTDKENEKEEEKTKLISE